MRKKSAILFAMMTCGAAMTAAAQGQGQQRQVVLPDGQGKEVVQILCTQCHGLNNIANSDGYTQAGWKALIRTMVRMRPEREELVTAYLATHFPEKPAPAAVLIPGPATVTFKDWMVPTLGSRPHDPTIAPDGAIWWTGQNSNTLGRVDPRTGAIREYTLKSPNSGPHGLVADAAGNIWYTGQAGQHVGKLDPVRGEVAEDRMPDSKHRGPHTP